MTQKRAIISLVLLLLLSLGGNFFQAGLIMGKNAELKSFRPVSLPASDQKILEEAMRVAKPVMNTLRQDMVSARTDIQKAMDAEPFEKEDLDAALKNMNDRKRDFLVFIQQQRAATLKKMSPEGRAILENASPRHKRKTHAEDYPPFIWEDIAPN